MIHGALAAIFCSTALLIWGAESIFTHRRANRGFAVLYAVGMLFWSALAWRENQSWLAVIGIVQFSAAVMLAVRGAGNAA